MSIFDSPFYITATLAEVVRVNPDMIANLWVNKATNKQAMDVIWQRYIHDQPPGEYTPHDISRLLAGLRKQPDWYPSGD